MDTLIVDVATVSFAAGVTMRIAISVCALKLDGDVYDVGSLQVRRKGG